MNNLFGNNSQNLKGGCLFYNLTNNNNNPSPLFGKPLNLLANLNSNFHKTKLIIVYLLILFFYFFYFVL